MRVLTNGRVQLNGEDLDRGAFLSRLEAAFLNQADRAIFVIPDENVVFGQVAAVIDDASLKVNHIALLSHAVHKKQGNCGPALPVPMPLRDPIPGLDSVHFWHLWQ